MIFESILIVAFAFILDFVVGDPKNRYHPTAWIGKLIGKLVPYAKNDSYKFEKLGGVLIVITVCSIVVTLLSIMNYEINLIPSDLSIIISIFIGTILLKTTIAIRGMEKHAISVLDSLEKNDVFAAREHLAKIVKRNTKNLDKNLIISGVLESISENTVDGITGPLFYFAFFGLPGAFVYRSINTIDSMIGYKTKMFSNIGWFGANCDKILNYIPARLTGLVMIFSAMILRIDRVQSYEIMFRDSRKLQSPNAQVLA